MGNGEVAVLLEEIRSQFKVFGEALQPTRESLERKIEGLDCKIDARSRPPSCGSCGARRDGR